MINNRQLTYQEANRLFQSALLIISQENFAKRQNKSKVKDYLHCQSLQSSPKQTHSPQKDRTRSLMTQNRELDSTNQDFSSYKSLQKTISPSLHKLSIQKYSSHDSIYENEVESSLKLVEKIQNSINLSQMQIKYPADKIVKQRYQEQQCSLQMDCVKEEKGILYQQGQIKQIKRDLQIKSRGKISKAQQINHNTGQVTGYIFYCKHSTQCPFDCHLQFANKRNSKGEKLYRLIILSQTHLETCLEEDQEISFMKLTKLIDSLQQIMTTLLSQNQELKPKEILAKIAEKLGQEDHRFIYKGLTSKNYLKAAKKYFDNLIYKVKNTMGLI